MAKSLFDSFQSSRFDDLIQSVRHCDLCPRLCCRNKVLSSANGNIESKVLFIAEAPGRLGADKTGIPLFGDRTGNNFELFLGNIGWDRKDIFITNAILCNPRKENGNNATPTLDEIENCSAYLEMTINLVSPEIVVPLGASALTALKLILHHDIQLARNVARPLTWGNRVVFPLYHPGPRAMVHRTEMAQRSDYMILQKLVDPIKGMKRKSVSSSSTKKTVKKVAGFEPIHHVVRAFLALLPPDTWITQFKITKLLYLFDLEAKRRLGATFAAETYIRQEFGPWPPKLANALKSMEKHEVLSVFKHRQFCFKNGFAPRFEIQLDENILSIISEVAAEFGNKTDSALRAIVYQTTPMKFILKQEAAGKNMMRKPVLHKDKEAQEID